MQAACINPLSEAPHAERILVIRLGAMGDVVRTLPAFAELRARYPHAHLAWLVERKAESALRGQSGLDEVIVFPREELEDHWRQRRPLALAREGLRFVAALRRKRFELVLDFHGILKSGVLSWMSAAATRIGFAAPFAREGSALFANHRVRVEPARISRFERNAALVDFLGIGLATVPKAAAGEGAAWPLDVARQAGMRQAVGSESRPFAVLHPGSSAATSYKRYPVSGWAAVARALRDDGVACCVAAGSEAERETARAVVAASDGAAVLAPPTPELADLAALVSQSRLFLGSDSGPLHVASLTGTPVVQLLGPTDPVENRPWGGSPYRSLRVPVGCSPCRRGCRAASCMNVLPSEAVVEAARALLAAPHGERRRA